jgi:phenylpropionate dioxygenase-like ring-hydroxylating dioxygenase large terminal subunit
MIRRKIVQQAIDVQKLLRLDEGFVHSEVYTSPEIFDLEIRRLFHGGWAYVGHESEIPEPGDYVLRPIGTQTVILNRDSHGRLHLFLNRCRHRANSLCQFDEGNASQFKCAYHGWVYKNSGELVGLPFREGAYPDDFDLNDYPLVSVRMSIYRGFIWGDLSNSNVSLDEHLGSAAKKAIDLFCDASPEGEIVLQQGCNKTRIFANWKFQGGDGYHTPFTHQANFDVMRARRNGGRSVTVVRGRMEEGWVSRDMGNGHYCLDSRSVAGRGSKLPDMAWAREYRASMIKSYGEARAEYLIRTGGNPHAIFMPNLQLLSPDVRVIRPNSVKEFDVYFYCAFLKGVPHELNEMRLRDTEDRMGPAGSINPDDVDMFERNQFGMQQSASPWMFMARGIERQTIDADIKTPEEYRMNDTLIGHYSDEVTQRAQLRWWADRLSHNA